MKWIKAILTFLSMVLVAMVLMNILGVGYAQRFFLKLLEFQLFGIFFAMPFIATCLIFASELKKPTKSKWMWRAVGIYSILIIPLVFLSSYGALAVLVFGVTYLAVMILATVLLLYLLIFEEKKQMKIITIVFIIILLLDILQLIGVIWTGSIIRIMGKYIG